VNESTLRTMLAERAERVEVGPAPLEDARRAGQHMRRRRSLLAASIGTLGVVVAVTTAALAIRPGSDASSAPVDSVSPTLDGPWQGTMRLEPPTAQPGATVAMHFPPTNSRGVAYSLAPWTGNAWADPEYYLTSDGGEQLGWTPGWWRVDQGENRGWPDIGISGPGPDRVVIPDTAAAGPYLLCTATAVNKACATLTVDAPTTDRNGTTLPGRVPSEDDLRGAWQVVTADGEPVADSLTHRERTLKLAGADWFGYDGCNSWFGHIELGPDGSFSTWGDGSTLKGCTKYNAIRVPSLIMSASSVRLDGDTLSLYGDDGSPLATFERAGPDSTPTNRPSNPHGSLSASEYALAVATAKQVQSTVTGTFVGATAVATQGPERCSMHIRLVWKADANFSHGGVPGLPPDGPRKALLLTVDPQTGDVCGTSAKYRDVGAAADETLLYGHWPG
jgi:heat shock protein HslJ